MIDYFLNPQSIEALGWTLLHSVWQGAVFAILLVLILIALRSYSAQSRYVVSVGLLCAFFLTLTGTFYLQWQDANGAVVSAAEILNEGQAHDAFVLNKGEALTSGTVEINATPYNNEIIVSSQSKWLIAFRDYYNQHLPLLVTIWFLGVLFLQLRFLGQLAYVQRLRHYGAQLFPSSWNDKIEELEGKLRIQKKVGYLTSIRVESPMVIGWLKPVVLMPQQLFNSLSETEIYAVLAHELAHIRREDFIVNLMQTFLCNVFFFHPGVWWISNRIDDEREHCCDDLAVAATGPATTYAKTLINVSELQLKMQGTPALAMALAGKSKKRERGGFSDRIRRLFMANSGAGSFREGFATALILVTALFLGVAATGSTTQTIEDTNPSDINKTEVISGDETGIDLDSSNKIAFLPPPPGSADNSLSKVFQAVDEDNLPIATTADSAIPEESAAPVNPDETRIDALVMACREGDFDFVKTLVNSGIDIEGVASNGVTPLMMAVGNQETEIVEYLLRQGADVNQSYNNWTALIEAADEGSLKSMQLLLKAGADVSFYENPGSPTAITMAASEGHLDCLQLLLENGADINGIGRSMPPLHMAAGENKKKIVDYLIAQKVDLNKQDASGRTALMHAASEGKKSIVIKLVEAGADISIVDSSGATAEDYAIHEKKYAIRDYLDGQDEDHLEDEASEDKEEFEFDNGWKDEESPEMHQATWDGHIEKVERMVEQGADVNMMDAVGRTPLHIASAEGYDLDMRVLFGLGADINAQDRQGRTPLMYAAADGKGDAVALLVSRQAEVNIRDVDGMSAFDWARSGGNSDLANFLGLITEAKPRSERNEGRSSRSAPENERRNIARATSDEKRQIKRAQKEQEKNFKNNNRTDLRTDVYTNVTTDQNNNVHTDVQTNNYKTNQKENEKRETFHVAADGVHLRQFNLREKTPELLKAVRDGDQQKCANLLSNGLSPNRADDTGQTALMVAASTNQYDIAVFLIAQGGDVNKSSISGLTALHYAALENHDKMARLLLKNNANVDPTMRYSSTDGNYGNEPIVWEYIGATPLLIATESGNVDVMSVLLDAGANSNHVLIRNEYKLNKNRSSYLSGGEVMGIDDDFLQDAELISSHDGWTPYKQALLLNQEDTHIIIQKK